MPNIGDTLNPVAGNDLTPRGLAARLNQRIVTAVNVVTEYKTRLKAPPHTRAVLLYPHPPYWEEGYRDTRFPLVGLSAPPRRVQISGRTAYQPEVTTSRINQTQALGTIGLRAPRRNEAVDGFSCQSIGERHQIDDVLRWGF